MATATKTWAFTSSAESWAYTGSQAEDTGLWTNARLENGCDGRNKLGSGYWELTGTFASIFGIPTNATVTGYSAASYSGTCVAYSTATDCDHFAVTINDGTDRTLVPAQSPYTAAGQTRSPSVNPGISGLSLPATTSITLRLNHSSDTANNASASARLSWDNLSIGLEYNVAVNYLLEVLSSESTAVGQTVDLTKTDNIFLSILSSESTAVGQTVDLILTSVGTKPFSINNAEIQEILHNNSNILRFSLNSFVKNL
jgi:hypothetical protein